MRIIVTGGSGFLGRHLLRALKAAGHQVVKNIDIHPSPENPDFQTVIADVRDADRMKQEIRDADVVFHLASLIEAGESVKFPQKFVDFNISGTVSVLEAMKENHVPIFSFSSSAAIYGEPLRTPIKEDDRTMPINPYGMTKLAMEALVSSYVATAGMTGIALRYFNLYGPEEHHEPETHAIPRFIKQIYNGEEVTVWGKGEHLRDFIYISDIVDAHLTALDLAQREPNKYHYLNISTNKPCSVAEVISTLEEIMGKKANIKQFPYRPGDPLVLTADATKAKEVMNWEAKMDLRQGLQKTVEYWMQQWQQQAPAV
jgi:nucleoside-diphosphate-sugar epimerase